MGNRMKYGPSGRGYGIETIVDADEWEAHIINKELERFAERQRELKKRNKNRKNQSRGRSQPQPKQSKKAKKNTLTERCSATTGEYYFVIVLDKAVFNEFVQKGSISIACRNEFVKDILPKCKQGLISYEGSIYEIDSMKISLMEKTLTISGGGFKQTKIDPYKMKNYKQIIRYESFNSQIQIRQKKPH